MPTSMIKPIIGTTPISVPVIHSAMNPPANASGTVPMTMNGLSSDWNCATMIR